MARSTAIDIGFVILFFLATYAATSFVPGGRTLTLQLGPNDHQYISGFAPHYEVEGDNAIRWTTYDSGVELPFAVSGDVTLRYRFARVFAETADVEVSLDGATVDKFSARGGAVQTRDVSLRGLSATPLSVHFAVDSHERRNLGLRLDWLQFHLADGASATPLGGTRLLPGLIAGLLFALFRFCGSGRSWAALCASLWIVATVVWLRSDPLGSSHVVSQIAVPIVLLGSAGALVLRRFPEGRFVFAIFIMGYVLRAGILFHPETFYPDVANARDYVEVFRETEGSLAARGVDTQQRTNVGYPRKVGGKDYAFPYSPLYFYPFGWAESPGAIEDAVRHAGLAASALAMLPLFWIATTAFGSQAAIFATLLFSVSAPSFSRLLLALHATVVGNFLDLLVIASVIALILRPESAARRVLVGIAILLALLVYTSSLFSVSAFILFVSLLMPKHAVTLLSFCAASIVVTIGWLYGPFFVAFVTEIVPALVHGSGAASAEASAAPPSPTPVDALRRIPLFFGYLSPFLAVVGFYLASRLAPKNVFRVLVAFSLAFVLMLCLRMFAASLFKDLKEITFVTPLIALLAAVTLDALWRGGRFARVGSVALTVWLVGFGLVRIQGYRTTYASPITAWPESEPDSP